MSTKITSDFLTFQEQNEYNDDMLVNGYIRSSENDSINIPAEIINLCIVFYHISKDRFDPELHEKDIIIADNEVSSGDDVHMVIYNAFLSNVVNYGQHHWSFKILERDDNFMYVGIWNNELDPKNYVSVWPQECSFDGKRVFYGLNVVYGELRGGNDDSLCETDEYCGSAKADDIVHMYLDLDKHELKYGINDEVFQKAFDVEPNASYRAIVSLANKESIELISYE